MNLFYKAFNIRDNDGNDLADARCLLLLLYI